MNKPDWFFAQISDPQFGMYRPGDDDYDETALMIRAVERLNALGPAFVLCTGDLIDVPGSDQQMEHARTLLNALDPDIPFLPVPGNHDIGDVPTGDALSWYRQYFGRDRFSFNHRGWHIVGLNSCILVDGSDIPDEVERQWAWLEDDLGRGGSREGTIVFMHHPLFLDRADEVDDYFNLPGVARRRCLEIFRRTEVNTVFCGHLHRCHEAAIEDLNVVVTGPVGMPLQDGYSGLRLVKIGEEGVRHMYFGLEDSEGQEGFVHQ